MATQSLIELEKVFNQATRDLLLADRVKQDTEEAYADAKDTFEAAKDVRDDVQERHTDKQTELAALKANLDAATAEYDAAKKAADDAAQKCSAAEQAASAKTKTKSAPNVKTLQKKAQAADADVFRMKGELETLQTEYDAMEELVDQLEYELRDAINSESAARVEMERAKTALDTADYNWSKKKGKTAAAKKGVESIRITSARLSNEWQNVRNLATITRPPRYLKISTPKREVDSIAQSILNRMARDAGPIEDQLAEIRRVIKRHGIATEVAKITKTLNRRAIPEISRFVLAVTYYPALMTEVEAAGPASKDIQRVFEDTLGVVEAIRIQQQNPDEGALRVFADRLVQIVAERRNLNLTDEKKQILAGQIHEKILY